MSINTLPGLQYFIIFILGKDFFCNYSRKDNNVIIQAKELIGKCLFAFKRFDMILGK